ncbi:PhzF family phenazine biosynthesis protein [Mesorhizobium sp. M0195]|uniref:PhzF family phenazine biosynthesis protein n=2 Tax=Mesorhizobium TaxID=68287 RepID=UPI00333BCEAC
MLGSDNLTTDQMQAVAPEFNSSETSFVLQPADAHHTAQVRIFTPTLEVPFAGHPTISGAFVLAGAGNGAKGKSLCPRRKPAGSCRHRMGRCSPAEDSRGPGRREQGCIVVSRHTRPNASPPTPRSGCCGARDGKSAAPNRSASAPSDWQARCFARRPSPDAAPGSG